jgi:hypothetical protein
LGLSASSQSGVTLLPTFGDSPPTFLTQDGFGSKAAKLAALLGHDASAKVLLIGSLPAGWGADFQLHFDNADITGSESELEIVLKRGTKYDFILWACPPLLRAEAISSSLTRLRRAMKPTASFFALVSNRYGARSFMRDPARILTRRATTLFGFRKLLSQAGFECVREFLPLPTLLTVEEFVSSMTRSIALPSYAATIEILLNRFGLLHIIHDGGVYIASGKDGGPERFLRALRGHLRVSAADVDYFEIDRFDLRDRGALIVFLRETTSGERFVCRVTTNSLTDRIVRRNAEWIDRLASADLSRSVKAAIPKAAGVISTFAGTAYVEAHIMGIVAWKLAGSKRLEPTLRSELCAFVTAFNIDTAKTSRVDEHLLTQLLDPFTLSSVSERIAASYQTLRDRLRARMLGRERVIVWSHGDFGYGNAIVDPRTARLHGVIDWDQAREDLAGVDLLHFFVQRERGHKNLPLLDALKEVAGQIIRNGLYDFSGRADYEREFAITAEMRSELLALVALRFAQRDMVYSSLSVTGIENTRGILEWGTSILGLDG